MERVGRERDPIHPWTRVSTPGVLQVLLQMRAIIAVVK
jgi:hypothetical protein